MILLSLVTGNLPDLYRKSIIKRSVSKLVIENFLPFFFLSRSHVCINEIIEHRPRMLQHLKIMS